MTFQTLAIISLVGLLGPLLATPRRWRVPVMLGELLAGILVGHTGLGLVDSSDPTLTLLADVGFALIMFVAGTHVPVRDAGIRSALGKGTARAGLAAVIAIVLGVATAVLFGTGHAPLYAVLLASSSAALVLPVIDSLKLSGPSVLQVTAQVAIADVAAIVALPIVIDPANAGRAALGAVAVAVSALLLYLALSRFEKNGSRLRLHRVSEDRKFALELRVQLTILFAFAALAVVSHVSIMLAGFSFGLAVAMVGEPRRLARQLFAIADGFLGPLFYVWLGASLNVLDLVTRPGMILLGVALGLGAVLAHASARLLGLPLRYGLLAAAQLGVPVAAATIGTQLNLLAPGEAAALILGALITIGVATGAAGVASRRQAAGSSAAPGAPAAPPTSA
ncbi:MULTISPECIES: cation:proton antiporter [unclassified Cryobacterium]|uniref:cation:proton antiporter n=1 Tax=unclassified Cryobacterium TaxID=2649013 RepID=UPI002AB4A740|nr:MULTISPECIES: cation:proton antiporter [unclassified Cryobacterium]MDY7541403.1 cation:proton antiporter [Cryobacterium sp. 5B3]MEB0001080.1 cation:proton antiporter [Cryobacterium sp. RTS3]MEB0267973.1 cation:proton antiporter [Cryobacterium sp. 10I5]MEB0273298.1 cation:proton antiporter [Cryobacterium sp. 5B3]